MYNKSVIFSFFSGSGFLDLGFETNGFTIAFANEISPAFLEAYKFARLNMGIEMPQYGCWGTDISEYLDDRSVELENYIADVRRVNNLVGFIGGPPCPDFSIGGKNRGRTGENGKLSLTYVNLLIKMQPDFFLFENVKGLWKTIKHRIFYEELKQKLHLGGYSTTECLLNSLEFGVPQDRERIFLFGMRNYLLHKNKFGCSCIVDFPWRMHAPYVLEDVKAMPWPQQGPFNIDGKSSLPLQCAKELTVQHWFDRNSVFDHPNAADFFKPRSALIKMQAIKEGDVSKKSFKRLHRWRYSPTVAYGNNEVHLHPYQARRISVAEALSIQSLPKEFQLPPTMSLSNMFKTIGNGVPFLLAQGIAKSISRYLKQIGQK